MAKALAYKRSTGQPVTIDTITGVVSELGGAIPGAQTTALFPARSTNLQTIWNGNPYLIALTNTGEIEVHAYTSGAWAVVAGPFAPPGTKLYTPLCIHVVNDTIVAVWTEVGGAGDGIRVITSTDGIVWSAIQSGNATIGNSYAGHSIVYRRSVWFATAEGLWAYHPLARVMTLAGVVGTYQVEETVVGSVSGTTAVVRSFAGVTLKIDDVSGSGFTVGETITGATSGATSTLSAISQFEGSGPLPGDDLGLSGATGQANLAGCFASWDGILYFLQPKTASGPTKLYRLDPSWKPTTNTSSPLWTVQTITGLPDASFVTVSNDSGLWSLFVNSQDELCIFYSGATSTKLAKTQNKSSPFTFTDLTPTLLPPSIAARANLGLTLYTDDRRRTNVLQWFLLRDQSAGNTLLVSWDGVNAAQLTFTLNGSDFILPASQHGEGTTYTNLTPAVRITGISSPFPGRLRIDYIVRSSASYLVDILPEFSIDGDVYFPMTEGDGDSGSESLPTSPAGTPYFFHWDAFVDLDGDYENMDIRVIARISGV